MSQEDAWPYLLDAARDSVEVVNLEVDGYSMGQAFLRWRTMAKQLEDDTVLLTFVPREDLIREVNTLRELMGWDLPIVVPRFRLERDALKLIRGPYRSMEEMHRANQYALDTTLISHLRKYDLLNDVGWFQSPAIIGRLVIYKLLRSISHRIRLRRLWRPESWAGSEAERISARIFASMNAEVEEYGARLILAYLPLEEDRRLFIDEPDFRRIWTEMVSSTCPQPGACLDLMDDFVQLQEQEMDVAIDGTHYGPRSNQAIASILNRRLDPLSRTRE